MKRGNRWQFIFIALALATGLGSASATTTITTNAHAYGANIGWLDWRGDTNNGAVIGQYVCSGYIYAANIGWLHLGNGAPANLIQYQNNSAADYGVNHDGLGNLRGYAYGADIGWVNFENTGAPTVDLLTGRISGHVYSANCGWISLSNAYAHVQTAVLATATDSDGDGLADAWEMQNFGNLSATPNGDPDGDGVSNLEEYLAATNPNDPASQLVITDFTTDPGGTNVAVIWQSAPTRQYQIQATLQLNPPSWFDTGLGLIPPDGSTTARIFAGTNAPTRYYRIKALQPLSP